jgi:isopenicillin-N epimerase
MNNLEQYFLLDPKVTFLNHGSFGACPRPVFEVYQNWQRQLEFQPVSFLGRKLMEYTLRSREILSTYLQTDANNLVYIPNATHGVNIIAGSLHLNPRDEILTTDHEYGACDYTWEFVGQKTGATYIQHAIPLPLFSSAEILESLWRSVTPRTRVIYLSHITSPTALCLPVQEICMRARRAGIFTVIDGAHAPGQIALDLPAIGADFYTGNCHKWMLCPKGAAFLYARQEVQSLVEPLVVSWGYHATPETTTGSRYLDLLEWTGTKDPAAILSVPSAIQFMNDHAWGNVQSLCHELLNQAISRICNLTNLPPLYPLDSSMYYQMGIAPLPSNIDIVLLKKRMYDEFLVEVPLISWNGQQFLRISIQGYNQPSHIDKLIEALEALLPSCQQT